MESNEQSRSGNSEAQGILTTPCVPELVRRRTAISAEALAVRAGSDSLTYQELDHRSNQLAHYLRSLGAIPGSVVAVCVERSVDFAVAALAILKAGAAYLPVDTKTPLERLERMLDTAQASLVLTNSGLTNSSALGSLARDTRRVVRLDCFAGEITRFPADAIPVVVTPEHLAYVIFTSGSTGTPKAVQVGHASLLNLIAWHNRTFEPCPRDRATQLASIGFDAAVWELWPYLVAGASVHLVDDETRTQPERLRDWLVRERITITFVPTPLAERMIKLTWPQETALRFLLTGADVLHGYPAPNLPFTVVNNYGPTECTVVATSGTIFAGKVAHRPPGKDRRPPIGKPIDNVELCILDGSMKPVPAGQMGEIFIGGACLAQGYLNDPASTAERFVRHPFSAVPGARLYRTGDLGSCAPDGSLEFHGRVDDQVKIRGYRIELNEVAGALLRHPGIRESAVVAGEYDQGEKRLVAYVVPLAAAPKVGELREYLANILPDYMIPAAFVTLEALPIGPNGKVDRSLLPAPSDENILRDETMVGPRTPTERRIAAIVGSLLGLDNVGMNDNFFFLGGNSLFATQVIARLRDAFNVEVSLLALFDHPTVAAAAVEVERLMVAKLDSMSEDEVQRLLASTAEAVDL